MIVGIEGKVVVLEPTFLHIKTDSGLIYQTFVSINTSSSTKIGENISLNTSFIVREDAQLLYGFSNSHEKEMFDRLLKISGVGASTAMAICSTFTPSSFMQIVQSSDINSLKMVPGIGPKSAKRILVELGEFALKVEATPQNKAKDDARSALESLGFKLENINKTLKNIDSSDTSYIVKEALKQLSKSK
jgi:Holliday junction DNA helicase RuvA